MSESNFTGENETGNLCCPDGEKTCFACCPPIRTARYEHLQYEGIVKRFLRENTAEFDAGQEAIRPITGFSCWALGYLDPECKLIGCLLHPALNRGKDLRYRVDFGEKCRREFCPEAKIFYLLRKEAKDYWLALTKGLDSFSYSSRQKNPLFNILNWGPDILNLAAKEDLDRQQGPGSPLDAFPFFSTEMNPRASAYLALRLIFRKGGEAVLRDNDVLRLFEKFQLDVRSLFSRSADSPSQNHKPHVNLLPMEWAFRDFLRLSLGVRRMDMQDARALKNRVDEKIDLFATELGLEDTPLLPPSSTSLYF